MKKNNIRSFVFGVLITTLLFGVTLSVTASTGGVSKLLSFNNIKVTLDGEKIDLKDANGNAVEPFIIEGTTYLPVRAVADALDLYVGWNQETNTVQLNSVDLSLQSSTKSNVIYNENGIRVIYKGMSKSDSYFGYDYYRVEFLVENNTKNDYWIETIDTSVNGYMLDYGFSTCIVAGKKSNEEITIEGSELERNDITSIDDLEFKLYCSDDNTGELAFESTPISLTKSK